MTTTTTTATTTTTMTTTTLHIRAHPVDRNTKAVNVAFGPVTLSFSYQTLIGVHVHSGLRCGTYRQANHWGPTTGRHFRELGYDNRDTVVTEDELCEIVREVLFDAAVLAPLAAGSRP